MQYCCPSQRLAGRGFPVPSGHTSTGNPAATVASTASLRRSSSLAAGLPCSGQFVSASGLAQRLCARARGRSGPHPASPMAAATGACAGASGSCSALPSQLAARCRVHHHGTQQLVRRLAVARQHLYGARQGGRGQGSAVVVASLAGGSGGGDGAAAEAGPSGAFRSSRRRSRRSQKPGTGAPVAGGNVSGAVGGGATGPSPSPVSSPVPPPSPAGGNGTSSGGVVAAASAAASVAVVTEEAVVEIGRDGGDSDYEGASLRAGGNHIVPFARRQPRALVLDCAYRPINVLTWYKAFHFEYFGKGEVLEYYPPPAVCTTGSGEFPLPAVLRVPQYTADMQDLCSRVACSRRNVMVRDGFCCQYCGARRDLTIDHVVPVSRGGRDVWDNLVTACMRCNQKKSDRSLRDLGWKLRRQPREPTPYEIGIVAGISTADILRPPPEWEAYIQPYRERLEMYRRAAVEAGLANLIEGDE